MHRQSLSIALTGSGGSGVMTTGSLLLEAAAMGRPVIAADTVGCRDVVEHGHNGYLCEPRDAAALADAMERMLVLSDEERAAMGVASREKAVREFDEQLVFDTYLRVIKKVLADGA
jgi:glycosyltransferase involved in cell wall biosynthesis